MQVIIALKNCSRFNLQQVIARVRMVPEVSMKFLSYNLFDFNNAVQANIVHEINPAKYSLISFDQRFPRTGFQDEKVQALL